MKDILINTAAKYGIPVVLQEESYTSKAGFLDGDAIPVYGDMAPVPEFSGKRTKRGLYRAEDGTAINADINGASNIIRKAYPYAYNGQEDLSYLYRTVKAVTKEDLHGNRPAVKTHCKERKSPGAQVRHRERDIRRTQLRQTFSGSPQRAA